MSDAPQNYGAFSRRQIKFAPEDGGMYPPWDVFPGMERNEKVFQAGNGPIYIQEWVKWYEGLDKESQEAYKAKFPEPSGWQGYYWSKEFIIQKRKAMMRGKPIFE